MMFHVYTDPKPEGYFVNEPFGIYRSILDADWLLYILLPFLLILVVALLMLAWRIHEIPAHKADHKKMRQAELVSCLDPARPASSTGYGRLPCSSPSCRLECHGGFPRFKILRRSRIPDDAPPALAASPAPAEAAAAPVAVGTVAEESKA
jgi:hypothetical protein